VILFIGQRPEEYIMSELERDYSDEDVHAEVLAGFHGDNWTEEDHIQALGNAGQMWLDMAQCTRIPTEDVIEASQLIHSAGLSEEFDAVFDAVIATCGLVVDGTNPAKVMGFLYGLHTAGEAAMDTFEFMRTILSDSPEGLEEEE
jgi:hypothetical protein